MPDVLVQKGHVAPREPGFENQTGTAGEQELVTLIANALAALLAVDGRLSPVVVPGDIPDGIRVDAALFLHADGSVSPEASGFNFGYPEYAVNRQLAEVIAAEFERLPGHPPRRRDNLTENQRSYYGYSRVSTLGPEVLVEHGFLTNPGERVWLFANVPQLAARSTGRCARSSTSSRVPTGPRGRGRCRCPRGSGRGWHGDSRGRRRASGLLRPRA